MQVMKQMSKHLIKSTIHLPLFVAKNDKEHDKAVSIWKGDKKSKHMDIYSKKGSGYKRYENKSTSRQTKYMKNWDKMG